MFELVEAVSQQAVIKVIGVGGGGGNAVEHMLSAELEGVDFINIGTNAQNLARSKAHTVLQIGENLTRGLGAGANPDIGRQAAVEDRDRIAEAIDGADMVFITAGMGGGTGTGATPVIAKLAKEKGILTVAVVTRPFPFEGKKRMEIADHGIAYLGYYVDSLIIISNEKVLAIMGQEATLLDAFARANDVLFNVVQCISELITRPGVINVDFADVRTVMSEMGMAMVGSATASGEDRAVEAAKMAISCPLLEEVNLHGAKGLLVNITAGPDMLNGEFEAVGNAINEYAARDAAVVIGTTFDPAMEGEIRVTLVATGIGMDQTSTDRETSSLYLAIDKGVDIRVISSVMTTISSFYGSLFGGSLVLKDIEHQQSPILNQPHSTEYRLRKRTKVHVTSSTLALESETLDIPAFLRKRAD